MKTRVELKKRMQNTCIYRRICTPVNITHICCDLVADDCAGEEKGNVRSHQPPVPLRYCVDYRCLENADFAHSGCVATW